MTYTLKTSSKLLDKLKLMPLISALLRSSGKCLLILSGSCYSGFFYLGTFSLCALVQPIEHLVYPVTLRFYLAEFRHVRCHLILCNQ